MKKIEKFFYHIVTHYNPDFYWSKRPKVVSKSDSTNKLIKLIWLFRLKRMEAYNNASFGTYLNHGAIIETQPILPHGLRGIHISSKAYIGKNVTIYQNCTIGVLKSNGGGPHVGNNCILGAGSALVGDITIGDNVKVGTNCVVNFDVPDNSTVVVQKARIIKKIK